MLTNLKRVFSFALADFYRNKGISLAAIFVLTVTTLIITGLFLVQDASHFLILSVQNKIDITAYFKQDTPEQDILNVKDEILKISPEIKQVTYVSKEQALNEFTEKNKGNDVFSKALGEVGGNPFLPSLNIITTGKPSLYEQVSNILESDRYSNIVEKVDFSQKKDTIEKVYSITSNINTFGLILGAIFLLIAVTVIFNTMRLVIYISKEEIAIMRAVGAPNWFVRAPFLFEGAIFGFISFVICFLTTILLVYFLSPGLASIIPGFNIFDRFLSNIWYIILIQLASGVGFGVISSFLAVRKYLNE